MQLEDSSIDNTTTILGVRSWLYIFDEYLCRNISTQPKHKCSRSWVQKMDVACVLFLNTKLIGFMSFIRRSKRVYIIELFRHPSREKNADMSVCMCTL